MRCLYVKTKSAFMSYGKPPRIRQKLKIIWKYSLVQGLPVQPPAVTFKDPEMSDILGLWFSEI